MTERSEAKDPEMSDGCKLSAHDAAQAMSVTRKTLQGYITSGRINTNPEGTIDAAELRRAGFIIRRDTALVASMDGGMHISKKTDFGPGNFARKLYRGSSFIAFVLLSVAVKSPPPFDLPLPLVALVGAFVALILMVSGRVGEISSRRYKWREQSKRDSRAKEILVAAQGQGAPDLKAAGAWGG